jgi:hypothetical protein
MASQYRVFLKPIPSQAPNGSSSPGDEEDVVGEPLALDDPRVEKFLAKLPSIPNTKSEKLTFEREKYALSPQTLSRKRILG